MATRQRAQRSADAAADRELRQCRDARGPCDADMHRTISTCPQCAIHRRIGSASKPNCVTTDTASPACRASATFACSAASSVLRIDGRMPFRIAGECDMREPRAFHYAGRQQIEAGTKRPDRAVVTTDQQDALNARLGHRPLQEIACLGKARKPPYGDVRHRNKAGALSTAHRRRRCHDASHWADGSRTPSCPDRISPRSASPANSSRGDNSDRARQSVPPPSLLHAEYRRVHQPESRLREITYDSSQNHSPPCSRSTVLVASR